MSVSFLAGRHQASWMLLMPWSNSCPRNPHGPILCRQFAWLCFAAGLKPCRAPLNSQQEATSSLTESLQPFLHLALSPVYVLSSAASPNNKTPPQPCTKHTHDTTPTSARTPLPPLSPQPRNEIPTPVQVNLPLPITAPQVHPSPRELHHQTNKPM
jgi:hypothetical protein